MSTERPFVSLGGLGPAFKFGQGVMGKSAVVVIVLILLSAAAMKYQPQYAVVVFLADIGVFCFWFSQIKQYAVEHPGLALAEGSTAMKWDQQIRKGKTGPEVIEGESIKAIPNPDVKQIGKEGDDRV